MAAEKTKSAKFFNFFKKIVKNLLTLIVHCAKIGEYEKLPLI